jgi:hypothetical protein
MLIFESDKSEYIDPKLIQKYNSFNENEKVGASLYLPRREIEFEGQGLMDVISKLFNFVNKNKDTIKNVTDSINNVSSGIDSTINTVSNINKAIQSIKNVEQNDEPKRVKGNGFKIIK